MKKQRKIQRSKIKQEHGSKSLKTVTVKQKSCGKNVSTGHGRNSIKSIESLVCHQAGGFGEMQWRLRTTAGDTVRHFLKIKCSLLSRNFLKKDCLKKERKEPRLS